MDSTIRRPIEVDDHPLLRKKYIIPTPSIDEFYKETIQCIRMRMPGKITYSLPRWGKTWAIRYCMNAIKMEFGSVPVYLLLCQSKKHASESAFFSLMLQCVGHAGAFSGKNEAKRYKLTQKMVEAARKSKRDFIVLFLDEAQCLQLDEYQWLRDIYNDLMNEGVCLVTFLVGQHQLVSMKTTFQKAGQTQIIGRFMTDEMQFSGLVSAEDFATCLHAYDNAAFPENSDWTYTRFFFPIAYQCGLRLEHSAALLFDLFSEAHKKIRPGTKIDIPMAYFSRTVEMALVDNMNHDAPQFELNALSWSNALKRSGFLKFYEELNLARAFE